MDCCRHYPTSFVLHQISLPNMLNFDHITPIEKEIRIAVDTATAAYHLNRQPQTLRSWSSKENGPIRPIYINSRMAWPVAEIRRILGCVPADNDTRYKFSA